MNDDLGVVETRVRRAFAETPDPIALAARDARVAATVRSARTRPMPPVASTSTRAWIGATAALVLVVVGIGAWWSLGPGWALLGFGVGATPSATRPAVLSPSPSPAAASTESPGPVAAAQAALDRGRAVMVEDPVEALRWCRVAWQDVRTAQAAGIDDATLSPVRAEVIDCLDTRYAVRPMPKPSHIDLSAMTPRTGSLVEGPDRRVDLIDDATGSVVRVDLRDGATETIIQPGDAGAGQPRLLASTGADLVLLDDVGRLWRWRRPNVQLHRLPAPRWPDLGDAVAMEARLLDADQDRYDLWVVDPSEGQIVHLNPAPDGGFSDAAAYLVDGGPAIAAIRDLVVDSEVVESEVFALTSDTLRRYVNGRVQGFQLATPPDDGDLRPGHDYRFVEAFDDRFYIYDAAWRRVLVFDRASGDYREQWPLAQTGPADAEVLGLELIAPFRITPSTPPTLVWMTASGLFASSLDAGSTEPEGSP